MFDRSKVWALGLLVASFAAGVAVGGVASAALGDRDRGHGRDDRRRPEISYLDRLDRELTLSPAQRDSVGAILKRYDDPMRQMFTESRQRFEAMRLQVRSDINRVLDPRQKTQFQAMNQRNDSLRAAREQRGESSRDR